MPCRKNRDAEKMNTNMRNIKANIENDTVQSSYWQASPAYSMLSDRSQTHCQHSPILSGSILTQRPLPVQLFVWVSQSVALMKHVSKDNNLSDDEDDVACSARNEFNFFFSFTMSAKGRASTLNNVKEPVACLKHQLKCSTA